MNSPLNFLRTYLEALLLSRSLSFSVKKTLIRTFIIIVLFPFPNKFVGYMDKMLQGDLHLRPGIASLAEMQVSISLGSRQLLLIMRMSFLGIFIFGLKRDKKISFKKCENIYTCKVRAHLYLATATSLRRCSQIESIVLVLHCYT